MASEVVMSDITEEISNKRGAPSEEEVQLTEKTPVKRARTVEANGSAEKEGQKTKEEREKERIAKQQEKEREKAERERQREELKKQREEARRLKQEEKQKKEQERLEEKRRKEEAREEERKRKEEAREEEKKRKEEERQAKLEEKKRKEQAKLEAKKAKEEAEAAKQKSHPSIFSFFAASKSDTTSTEKKNQEEQAKSYFEMTFLPFCVRSNCKLITTQYSSTCSEDESIMGWLSSKKEKRGRSIDRSVREIMDLVQLGQVSEPEIMKKLEPIPKKHLQFGEDVRPPYIGTISHTHNELATNPFERAVKTLNYDFDSECEWEIGDEEGSDLGDDDEDDEDIEESDTEMDQFLEEDDSGSGENRRNLVSHLNPIIKWNDGKDTIFREFQICCMVDTDAIMSEGIDPYKNYWAVEKKQSPAKPKTALDLLSPKTGKKTASLPAGLSATDIKAFLQKVQGQTAIKPILVETLKQAFPPLSKKAIDATISQVAVKVAGPSGEKQWRIIPEVGKEYGFE